MPVAYFVIWCNGILAFLSAAKAFKYFLGSLYLQSKTTQRLACLNICSGWNKNLQGIRIIWVVKASGNERVGECVYGGGILPNSEEEKKTRRKATKKKNTTHIPPDTTKAFHGLTAGQN